MAYKHALDLMTELYKHTNNTLAEDYSQRSAAIGKALHDNCWDGQWFVRCFDDNGSPVGSSKNEEGKIYLNAQSWALISGIADDEQKTSLLDACDENLKMDIGYRLVSPPYLKRDDYIGRISYLEPGICENGTIYTHGNAFFMLAQLMQNDGDKAYDVFKKITPGYLTDVNSPKQKCPPYIYANGYYAPEHRNNALQMEFTWITGSISWLINAIIDHMIGVRRDYDKLIIDPVLPKEWDTVTINRTFRNKLFNVTINQTGNKSVTLNGKKLENNFIYLSETADVNDVIVEI
jgi:cellobiose phosphorylase